MPILFIAVQAQEKAICFFLCLESILYSLKGPFIPAPKGTGFSGPMDYKEVKQELKEHVETEIKEATKSRGKRPISGLFAPVLFF